MRRWRRALAFQAALSGLVAFAMTALWAMTGGGTFWPMWVWYGLAIPFGLNAALFGAFHVRPRPLAQLRRPRGAVRVGERRR